jgi:hypothetical protein
MVSARSQRGSLYLATLLVVVTVTGSFFLLQKLNDSLNAEKKRTFLLESINQLPLLRLYGSQTVLDEPNLQEWLEIAADKVYVSTGFDTVIKLYRTENDCTDPFEFVEEGTGGSPPPPIGANPLPPECDRYVALPDLDNCQGGQQFIVVAFQPGFTGCEAQQPRVIDGTMEFFFRPPPPTLTPLALPTTVPIGPAVPPGLPTPNLFTGQTVTGSGQCLYPNPSECQVNYAQ